MLTDLLNEETTQAMFMCVCPEWFFLVTPRKFSSPHFLPVPKHAWLLIAGIIAPISLLLPVDKLTKG